MSAMTILQPYLAGRPMERALARDMAQASYDELVTIVARHTPQASPEALVASWLASALIAATLGATRMRVGANRWTLTALRGVQEPRAQGGPSPFGHAWTFFKRQRLLAILNRPYSDTDESRSTLELAANPALSVWALPSSRCSYHPGATTSYLITRRDYPPPGMGFGRLDPPSVETGNPQ